MFIPPLSKFTNQSTVLASSGTPRESGQIDNSWFCRRCGLSQMWNKYVIAIG
jgi:hypothetical protein